MAETGNAARGLLDVIERENLFLIPLDDERDWYRYHHLFANLIRLLLEQAYPGLSAELHRRACHWYEAQDMIPEALGQNGRSEFPVEFNVKEKAPARLAFETEFPVIRGGSEASFNFSVTVKNEGDDDLSVRFVSDAPRELVVCHT